MLTVNCTVFLNTLKNAMLKIAVDMQSDLLF